jgi:glutathione S-transferase
MMTSVLRILDGDPLLDDFPTLKTYITRHTSRPAFRKGLADHLKVYDESVLSHPEK